MLSPLVIIAVIAQGGADSRLGLTDAQILKMGGVDFVNEFTEKFGSSTAAMVDGWDTYGRVILKLNDKALAKKTAQTRTVVKSLRKRLATFRNEFCDIGRSFSGGGTMWNITYSETLADVEDAMTTFSGIKSNKTPARVVSDVTKAIAEVEKTAKEHFEEIDSYKESGGGMKEATSSLKAARAEFAEILKIAAKRSRKESDAVLDFCVNAAKIPMDQFAE